MSTPFPACNSCPNSCPRLPRDVNIKSEGTAYPASCRGPRRGIRAFPRHLRPMPFRWMCFLIKAHRGKCTRILEIYLCIPHSFEPIGNLLGLTAELLANVSGFHLRWNVSYNVFPKRDITVYILPRSIIHFNKWLIWRTSPDRSRFTDKLYDYSWKNVVINLSSIVLFKYIVQIFIIS